MACSSCSKRKKSALDPQQSIATSPVVDFTILSTTKTRIRSGNKDFPITLPLIKLRPPSGYAINILVKGHKHTAQGQTARQVVVDAVRLYEENGVEMTELNAWFNANIHWLKQLNVRHGYTTVGDLMLLAE